MTLNADDVTAVTNAGRVEALSEQSHDYVEIILKFGLPLNT